MIRILVVDDEGHLVETIRKKLAMDGMQVYTAPNGREAISIMERETLDIGLFDIKLPDIGGVELLGKLRKIQPTSEVIMLTAYASVDSAIQCLKLGAYDYLTKPCKLSELHQVILKAYEKKQLREKTVVLEEHLQRVELHDKFIGEGKEIKKIKAFMSLASASIAPLLILGETGTGKELVARGVHALSPRSARPFVALNSSCLQESILESELFGYKKGAFTGAQADKMGLLEIADKGTFFVDEVGDMSGPIQAKVLRVLETGVFRKVGDTREIKVDIRFMFATNKDLTKEIEQGRFRKDLFFRINTFTVNLPLLARRRDDIPRLATYFLDKFTKTGKGKRFTREAMEVLTGYHWPGNVRELANVIERAVLLSGAGTRIVPDYFPEVMLSAAPSTESETQRAMGKMVSLARLEKEHIESVLQFFGGNKTKAARLLGVSRKTLYNKIGEPR